MFEVRSIEPLLIMGNQLSRVQPANSKLGDSLSSQAVQWELTQVLASDISDSVGYQQGEG